MGRRYVDEDGLIKQILVDLRIRRKVNDDDVLIGVESNLRGWLGRQPTLPRLISAAGMAKLLGVSRPNIYKRAGRPEGVPVQGGADVYLLDEAEAWKDDIDREKEAGS